MKELKKKAFGETNVGASSSPPLEEQDPQQRMMAMMTAKLQEKLAAPFTAWLGQESITPDILTKRDDFIESFLKTFYRQEKEHVVHKLFRERAEKALKAPSPEPNFDDIPAGHVMRMIYPGELPFPAHVGSRWACKFNGTKGFDNTNQQDFVEVEWLKPEQGGPPMMRQQRSTQLAGGARMQAERPPMKIHRDLW